MDKNRVSIVFGLTADPIHNGYEQAIITEAKESNHLFGNISFNRLGACPRIGIVMKESWV